RGNGADDHVGRAEPGGKGRQDGCLRCEGEADHEQAVVSPEQQDVARALAHDVRTTTPSAISTARTIRATSMLGCSSPLAATIAGSSGRWMKPARAGRPRSASSYRVVYSVWLQR